MSSDFKEKAANKSIIEASTNKNLNSTYLRADHEDLCHFV